MGLTGIGLGFSFAAMPGLIIRSVPPEETGSALGFYQVVRYVGFSLGSAASATILASYTPLRASFPHRDGFVAALLMAAAFCVVAALVSLLIRERLPIDTRPVPRARLEGLETEMGEVSSAGLPFNTEPQTIRVLLEDRYRAESIDRALETGESASTHPGIRRFVNRFASTDRRSHR